MCLCQRSGWFLLQEHRILYNESFYARHLWTCTLVERNGAPGMQHKKIILKLTPNITDGLQPHIYVEEERSDSEGSKQSAVHRWLDFKGANQQPVLFGNLQCLITGSYTGGGGQTFCTLWIPEEALQNAPDYCRFIMLTLCGDKTYNAYEAEQYFCSYLDRNKRMNSQ
ncbi:uncharacterized protein LOC142587387 isoform X2 [Dermacentor variabilis]|uniref:uncharacterized protein LOC142587387 isoform X2 n=1 Tax=Dermacentor variabilis TaxID=34621 RepID=UPI003F5B59A5